MASFEGGTNPQKLEKYQCFSIMLVKEARKMVQKPRTKINNDLAKAINYVFVALSSHE